MNQASCACAYVYDCCKLRRVFFFRAADSPHDRPSPTLSSSTSLFAGSLLPLRARTHARAHARTHTHIHTCLFFISQPFRLRSRPFLLLRPAARLHPPPFEGCTSSSGSSNVLFILFIESHTHSTKLYSTSRVLTRAFFSSRALLRSLGFYYNRQVYTEKCV